MKSKKTTYLLLGVVILIWVLVFIRIFNFFKEDDSESTLNKRIRKEEKSDLNDIEHFEISGNYRDPFLGIVNNPGNVPVKKVVKPSNPETLKFDFVFFHGTINNKQANKRIALLNIHGKEYMASEGDKIEGVSFIKNFIDSIKVSYSGKIYYLKRN